MIDAKAINHLGIAVTDLEQERDYYETVLGAKFEGVEEVADQKVKVAFYLVGPAGAEVRLELLEPTSDDSPIAKFIEKNGGRGGMHHVAYTVENIEKRLAELKEKGVRLIDETPRSGAHHTKIAFLHPKASNGVLTELCEPAKQ
jgi:methylmalonyl-CoA/ethylmalonyl-CoA epimerase